MVAMAGLSYNCWISRFDSFWIQEDFIAITTSLEIWTVNSLLFHDFQLGKCLPLSLIFLKKKNLLPELLLKKWIEEEIVESLMKWLILNNNNNNKNTSLPLFLFSLVVSSVKKKFSFHSIQIFIIFFFHPLIHQKINK